MCRKDGKVAETAAVDSEVAVFLDKTPFYAEMGGQVGDIGIIKTDMGTVEITNCIKVVGGKPAHIGVVVDGEIKLSCPLSYQVQKYSHIAFSVVILETLGIVLFSVIAAIFLPFV